MIEFLHTAQSPESNKTTPSSFWGNYSKRGMINVKGKETAQFTARLPFETQDYVAETARNAVGLADQLGIDKAKDAKSC